MSKSKYSFYLLLISFIIGITVANAQANKGPLQSNMQAFVITVNADGKEASRPAEEVEPGEVIEYLLTYENISEAALQGIAVTGPIPDATAYIANTANTPAQANFTVSIDNGKTFESEPVKRMIKNAQGEEVETIIPPSEYSHIRWTLNQPLQGGEKQTFRYRSVVN